MKILENIRLGMAVIILIWGLGIILGLVIPPHRISIGLLFVNYGLEVISNIFNT